MLISKTQNQTVTPTFKSSLFGCLLLLALSAQAASLGRMTVQSSLGESFRADIDIGNLSTDEISSLLAKTASPESFRRMGVEFNPAVLGIKAALVNDGARAFVQLRSLEGIQEPLFDLLIEISSDKGSLVKKYTVFLDPPVSKQTIQEPASQPLISQSVQSIPLSASGTLSLKPSFNLNPRNLKAIRDLGAANTQTLSKRELRALKKAQRKANRDTLTVQAATEPKTLNGQETPQALARRLVKSGIKDPAQIEALIDALNAAKQTTSGKPNAKTINTSPMGSTAPSLLPSETANNTPLVKPSSVTSVPNLPANSPVNAPVNTPVNATQTPETSALQSVNSSATTPAPQNTIPPAASNTAPPKASQNIQNKARSWMDVLDDFGLLIGLVLAGLLTMLAWLLYNKRLNSLNSHDDKDYKPLNTIMVEPEVGYTKSESVKDALGITPEMGDTKYFESRFLTQIKIDESLVQTENIEPMVHAKNMIQQGDTANASSILRGLLLNDPDDAAVRVMLIELLINKQDEDGASEQMALLEKTTSAKGAHWEEATHAFHLFKADQLTLQSSSGQIDSDSKTEQPLADELENHLPAKSANPDLDLPFLALDLSTPTAFARPDKSSKNDNSILEFDLNSFDTELSELATNSKTSEPSSTLAVPKIDEGLTFPNLSPNSTPVKKPLAATDPSEELLSKPAQLEADIQKNELIGAQALLKSMVADSKKPKVNQ